MTAVCPDAHRVDLHGHSLLTLTVGAADPDTHIACHRRTCHCGRCSAIRNAAAVPPRRSLMRRTLLGLTLSAALLTAGCAGSPAAPDVDEPVEFEVEDCDRGDALEGDSDCTASQIRKARDGAKRKSPAAVAPPKKLAPPKKAPAPKRQAPAKKQR